ncbi:polyphosphate glucokinase [Ruaniaceae bacterium KH17]|nr:polyphosphate glucokinase [Ruaniaceae bacterium KH17]
MTTTLAIDCGGGGIKASVLDESGTLRAHPTRAVTPYPLPPALLVSTIVQLAEQMPAAERVTVGMPGMIRHGIVVQTPHYICKAGPRTKVLPKLVAAWEGFDMREAVSTALDMPALVLNDAEVHGCGLVTGRGLEMVITLGTGLGNAIFDNGRLAPHAELSRGITRWGLTYDEYLGEHERIRLGDAQWSRRARIVIESWVPVYLWDRLYLGGGNSRRITKSQQEKLPENVILANNSAGIIGGVRAWDMVD